MANLAGTIQSLCQLVFFLACCVVINLQIRLSLVLGADTPFKTNYATDSDAKHCRILNNGTRVQLVLDKIAASAFSSKKKYLFGKFSMRLKLARGDSAGTVTTFYLSASNPAFNDEMDFEFLGNVSGQPYILQTNVFADGRGDREQRIYLWFDPTTEFHEYSILWNSRQIVFSVDGIPIRVYKNHKQILGMPFPDSRPVRIYSSIWDGGSWATQNGAVKLNWNHAPFIATYEKFDVDACVAPDGDGSKCLISRGDWWEQTAHHTLSYSDAGRLNWVKDNFVVYNYCTDKRRNPVQPAECRYNLL